MELYSIVVWGHHGYLLANATLYNIPQINHNFVRERKQIRNVYKKKKIRSYRYVHKRKDHFIPKTTVQDIKQGPVLAQIPVDIELFTKKQEKYS